MMCRMCTSGTSDSPAHVLFECTALQDARDRAWADLSRVMPNAMLQSVGNMNSNEKLKLMMSCYGGNYIPEWDELYGNTAKMVFKLYTARYEGHKISSEQPMNA